MKLFDALFNWLQIKIVADARPDDKAAVETRTFFEQLLKEDHDVSIVEVKKDDTMYHIRYQQEGETVKTQMFDRESSEQLLDAIENEPKFGQ
ncbi:MAG: hypothetical protein H0Z33_04675 [Bacillaceae bacterium]|nr:hypothetical protein [Bacillaceae bacterium]